jgi:hypothetical protein
LLSPRKDLSPSGDPYPHQRRRARARAGSEATEIPDSDYSTDTDTDTELQDFGTEHAYDAMTITETFPVDVEVRGVTFNTVRLFHPRPGSSLFHLHVVVLMVVGLVT